MVVVSSATVTSVVSEPSLLDVALGPSLVELVADDVVVGAAVDAVVSPLVPPLPDPGASEKHAQTRTTNVAAR